jgi:hypothetical protein
VQTQESNAKENNDRLTAIELGGRVWRHDYRSALVPDCTMVMSACQRTIVFIHVPIQ